MYDRVGGRREGVVGEGGRETGRVYVRNTSDGCVPSKEMFFDCSQFLMEFLPLRKT